MLMNHKVFKFVSILLVLCVLSVGGLAQAQSVEHAGHHAHHQAATHGTVLCSWMCAAGQAGEAATILVPLEVTSYEFVEITSADQVPTIFSVILASRSPPVR
jgi:hypothetical protein